MIYLSLGAGVQSTALYYMSERQHLGIPRADVAVFADTGDEPSYVYEQIERMKGDGAIPIQVVRKGHLSADIIARHRGEKRSAPAIPAYTRGPNGSVGKLQKHCTRDYKVIPILRYVRSRVGRKGHATAMIGISWDEMRRMKDSKEKWVDNTYPLVEHRLNRTDCMAFLESIGKPLPGKSACVFCPMHSGDYWRNLASKHPADFAKAARIDEQLRDMTASGIMQPVFMHRSLKPVASLDFDTGQGELFQEECEGMCGV